MNTFIITGISGYLGQLLAVRLAPISDRIIGICRNTNRARQELEKKVDLSKFSFIRCDLSDSEAIYSLHEELEKINMFVYDFSSSDVYLIHCAAVTSSREMVTKPVEVADGIVSGTNTMLKFARNIDLKSFVFLSSMEVYGSVENIGRPRAEEELGSIDLSSPRSCYPMAKRMAEHFCHTYAQEYGLPIKIARLAQTFGIGANPNDSRVFMQFAKAVKSGQDIILNTAGKSMGNYCAADDAIEAVLTILFHGNDNTCYNVVNEANTMTIKDMANLVVKQIAGGNISVRVEEESSLQTGYAADTGLMMSSQRLRDLGWKPKKSLEDIYWDVLEAIQ